MKFYIMSFALVCLIATNCNKKASHDTLQNGHNEISTIALNDGKKWKVVPHMLVIIREMEQDIQTFDQQDYTSLSEKLKENIEALTSNCTMEGQAHDELHKWLLPFIDKVEALSNAKEKETAKAIFLEIKTSFLTFNQFFE